MINNTYIDPSEINYKETIKTDVCIIGGGAAGISLALEFCDQNFNVLIIESGEKKFKHRNQHLGKSKSIGIPAGSIMFGARRQFGGTTVTWSGRCRPLDEIDFIQKDWIPNSGWPFNKSELEPYYLRSQEICELGEFDYSLYTEKTNGWFDRLSEKTDFEAKPFMFSAPTNFATTHGPTIENSSNVNIILNSNAVTIELASNGKDVKSILCKMINGKIFSISSKIYILAAGGLEITKLLLSSNEIQKTGVGNKNDLVGRYFMDHPHLWSGAFKIPKQKLKIGGNNILRYGKTVYNRKPALAIGLKEEYLQSKKLTNAAGFFIYRPWHKIQTEYLSSVGIAFQNMIEILKHQKYPDLRFLIKNILILGKNIRETMQYLLNIVYSSKKKEEWVGIISQFEQTPNAESRVKLGQKLNSIGQANMIIDWKLSEQDLNNIQQYNLLLKKWFDNLGLAFNLFPTEIDENGIPTRIFPGMHYMGITRMNNDPKLGVVDENCKVHGISNLFISSSSVFPTSGQTNPTLTIIALAIKLADHVKNNYFKS